MKKIFLLIFCAFLFVNCFAQPIAQKSIARVDKMPNHPKPYAYKDWKKTAIDFDNYVFDFNQKGDYLPLIWLDSTHHNANQTTFGFYTAIGDRRMGPKINHGENHEALGALGAVLGATLVGIDKSSHELPIESRSSKLKAQSSKLDYVGMLKNYFNTDNGWKVIENFTNEGAHIGGGYGNDFWYEVHNNVLFYCIADLYPNEKGFTKIMRTIAEQFYKSDSVMGKNYSYSFFDFKNMKPGKNQVPAQEDVAAGYAFILYSAYIKFGNEKYLRAAKNAMDVLYNQKENRFYEAMMPLAAYIGARMNVEQGTHYDIQRFLDWTFNGDAVGREGWGVLVDKWGTYDVSGMLGSTVDHGGYGFLMNTFDLMMPLSALVKYDPSYARAVGKWALNASNAARFCYPYDMPDSLQALPLMKSITKNVIAYEGIIKNSSFKEFEGITPFAQGDGPHWAENMAQSTMFSVYGSSHVGFFGATIQKTDVPEILQINCNATDFFKKKHASPTYLLYNPNSEEQAVHINVGKKKVNVYDKVSGRFLLKGVNNTILITIPADKASVIELQIMKK